MVIACLHENVRDSVSNDKHRHGDAVEAKHNQAIMIFIFKHVFVLLPVKKPSDSCDITHNDALLAGVYLLKDFGMCMFSLASLRDEAWEMCLRNTASFCLDMTAQSVREIQISLIPMDLIRSQSDHCANSYCKSF